MLARETADEVVLSAAQAVWRRREELPNDSEFGAWFLGTLEKEFWTYRQPIKGRERKACSFCGKTQDQVHKLIAGPTAYICDQCIDLCVEVLQRHPADKPPKTPRGE